MGVSRSGAAVARAHLALWLALSACAPAAAGDAMLFAGEPVPNGTAALLVLDNPGFRVGYSPAHRQPLWVGFRAESVRGKARLGRRPDRFTPDARVPDPVGSRDYLSGKAEADLTRGHLAPNYLIGKLHGRAGQLATFLMSNISPQSRRLNELVWQRLEEAEVDVVAPALGPLFVLTGPVFGPSPRTLRKSGVAVPEAFYRIWVDVLPSGEARALAFIVPQQVCGAEPLSSFLATVDEIEQRTQLDFHAPLDDAVEAALEASRDTGGWTLERFDRRPPRYADNFGSLQC